MTRISIQALATITTSSPFQANNVDQTRSFPPEARAAAGVRSFVADWLSGRGLDDWAAVLPASELASNAAEHAPTEFTVGIGMRGGKSVFCEVLAQPLAASR